MEHKTSSKQVDIERRTISVPVEIRMADQGATEGRSRTVEGYAAVYNSWADMGWMREMIVPGAFRSALENSDIRALFNHDRNHVLAREKSKTLTVWEDEKGLGFRFDIPVSRDDIVESVERGDVDEMSFAFLIKSQRWVLAGEGSNDVDERYLEEFEKVIDISLVTFPAYNDTTVALRCKEEYRSQEKETESGASAEHDLMMMQLCLSRHAI